MFNEMRRDYQMVFYLLAIFVAALVCSVLRDQEKILFEKLDY